MIETQVARLSIRTRFDLKNQLSALGLLACSNLCPAAESEPIYQHSGILKKRRSYWCGGESMSRACILLAFAMASVLRGETKVSFNQLAQAAQSAVLK